MEQSLKPDKKYFTKCNWILFTTSVSLILSAAVAHLVLYLVDPDPEAVKIIWLIAIGAIFLMWIISYPIIQLWLKNLEYIILPDRVTIHKGILTKTRQNIPFRSITDFILVRTIFDRILGIGSVKIQTAGQSKTASGYEGSLVGLLDYDSILNTLRKTLQSLHPTSESVTTAEPMEQSDSKILIQILDELKQIRKNTEGA